MNSSTLSRRDFFRSSAGLAGGVAAVAAAPKWLSAAVLRRDIITRSFWTMGTGINLSLHADHPASTYAAAFSRLQRVNDLLSAHDNASELGQLNMAGHTSVRPSDDMLAVARAAIRYGDMTDGAIDVTVAPAMRRLGFLPPSSGQAMEVIDYRALRVHADRVALRAGGYEVDFGGIAKGYALDEAVTVLQNAGVTTALVEAGGDLLALGRPEPTTRWRIGVRDPFHPSALFGAIDVEDCAVATSGLYAQTRTVNGRTVTHIIDPATGQPASHVVSATIVARSAMEADALATATSVMEAKRAQTLVARLDGVEGLWIYADGSMHVSQGLVADFHRL